MTKTIIEVSDISTQPRVVSKTPYAFYVHYSNNEYQKHEGHSLEQLEEVREEFMTRLHGQD